jgi:regulatory protein
MGNTPFSEDPAWQKIRHYCSYRERCHFEVKQKLFSLGLPKKQVEILICRLIEEDLLNEERFAKLFAGGHFRQKKWGKMKIIHALRLKKLTEPVIKKALKEIDAPDYGASLQKLAAAKWNSLRAEKPISRQAKTSAYLLQKGYEGPLVRKVITALSTGKDD